MKNSEQRARMAASAIAHVRMHGEKFTKEELIQNLKNINCPYALAVFSFLKKEGLISKNNGVYTFADSKPVYFGILKPALDEASSKNIGYFKKSVAAKAIPKDPIEDAIALLKSKGFKIMRQVIEFVEC